MGEETPDQAEEEKKNNDALRLACHLNKAACHLQLKQNSEAVAECDLVWTVPPSSLVGCYNNAIPSLKGSRNSSE